MRWFESSYPSLNIIFKAGVAELADALDSKSSVLTDVPVRPRPPVYLKRQGLMTLFFVLSQLSLMYYALSY